MPSALWEPAQGFPPTPSVIEPVVAKLLDTTALFTLLSYTPSVDAGLVVRASAAVKSETTLTVYCTFTDSTGAARTVYLLPTTGLLAGAYPLAPATLSAEGGHAVTVYAQAGTQTAAYLTCGIDMLV